MTLILSAVSGDHAFQVSDRRLTRGNAVLSDETNKAVVFCGRAVISYTGLAYVGKVPTDEWLTKALVDARTASLSDAFDSLAQQATLAFKKIGYGRVEKRHAFVSVGWARLRNEMFLSPIICSVSNACDENGVWLRKANEEFSAQYTVGPRQPCFNVKSHGQPLKDLTRLREKIQKCFEEKTGPEPIIQHMIDEVHRIAARNSKVGKGLMIMCLPKSAVMADKPMMLTDLAPSAAMAIKDTPSFFYLARDAARKVSFAPNLACAGQGFRNVKLKKLNRSGRDVTMEATIVLPDPQDIFGSYEGP